MREVSLNARLQQDAQFSGTIPISLIKISHPELTEPIKLSTDNTETISVDPLIKGTRSTWLTDDGSPYLYVVASTQMPSDEDDVPPGAIITISAVGYDVIELLQSTKERATVDVATVTSDDTNTVNLEYLGLELVGVEGDAATLTLQFSGASIFEEPYTQYSFNKDTCPGLFK